MDNKIVYNDGCDGLTRSEIIVKYQRFLNQINDLRKCHKISNVEYQILLLNSQLINTPHTIDNNSNKLSLVYLWSLKKIIVILFILLISSIGYWHYYKSEVSGLFMKNVQNYIHPGMSIWRKVTLPILRTFPSLSSLYDETCLLQNPIFQIPDIDCTPCMNTVNIMDLTNIPRYRDDDGGISPYIFKANTTTINLNIFYKIYQQYQQLFKNDAYTVQSTKSNIENLDDLFDYFLQNNSYNKFEHSHNLWRCNRMTPARLLRQYVPHPIGLSSIGGMSIERFIAIDTSAGPSYTIPDPTDCSNVFIHQLMGTRTIVLRPTYECNRKCRRLFVRLEENYVLQYDWWYWKPISMPDHQQPTTSISYIGAIC